MLRLRCGFLFACYCSFSDWKILDDTDWATMHTGLSLAARSA
jgi:hypothetical protein